MVGYIKMTMLASWICFDPHGPTSAYIVSDSRFSTNKSVFDYGKKVFASKQFPEIFGYCGDVLFPSVILSQIVEMIDSGILINEKMNCDKKNSVIFERICYSLKEYKNILHGSLIEIIHITRDTVFDKYPNFYAYKLKWTQTEGIKTERILMKSESGIIEVMGAGESEFSENYKRYQQGKNRNTSRNVFHCFLDTLSNTKKFTCGGAPQLVGIYRKPFTGGKNYGIIYNNKRYFLGMGVPTKSHFKDIEWRNELFELCSGYTKKRIPNAKKQPDSLRRK